MESGNQKAGYFAVTCLAASAALSSLAVFLWAFPAVAPGVFVIQSAVVAVYLNVSNSFLTKDGFSADEYMTGSRTCSPRDELYAGIVQDSSDEDVECVRYKSTAL